jgi:hypothetical protein
MVVQRGGVPKLVALNTLDDDDENDVRPPPPWLTDVSVLSVCNFILGHALAFPETFFSYTLVENFDPSIVQLVYCVLFSPWIAKPLYAMIVDRGKAPLHTYVPRLLPISAVLWFVILIAEELNVTLCLFVLDALVIYFADVALDTIMVKRAKVRVSDAVEVDEREIQSHVLIARSVGMMVGAYLGGLVMNAFGGVAVFACCIIEAALFCALGYLLSDVRMPPPTHDTKPPLRELMTPQMKKALFFTILVHAVPDLSGLYDFVLIDELEFTPVIIGSLDMIGYVAMAMGAFAYNRAFRGNSNMRMVQLALVVMGIESIIPIAVVLRWNRHIGMEDVTIASLDGFFRAASQRMLVMPITGAIMPYCTAGHDGTIYALFTALSNIASIVALMLGSIMSKIVGLSRNNMHALWILFVVRGACLLLLAPAAVLLPDKPKTSIPLLRQTEHEDAHTSVEIDG